ncbi:hypothetical protein NIES267_23140 [Calothrix parasitica NIES-267]|uniref:Uncharacterized protein n=1 Tax=Calothrix parasitica NIES-267 TaxID=1973488 RepID=A0A1Z4LNN7_9CYAN|nr:hypothetical protein NIES267_23140 [Calothrix parasitica NIES-267]
MIAAILLIVTAAFLSVAFPLATYTLTLAIFGLAHVLTELRYVNSRFKQRLNIDLQRKIFFILLIIVNLRISQLLGVINSSISVPLELVCVIGLVALVIPILKVKDWKLAILGISICIMLSAGVFWIPTLMMLLLAVLHNLTPIGFIAERLRGLQRKFALFICLIVFGLIPSIIISGYPYNYLSSLNLVAPSANILQAGNLQLHLGAFVPQELHESFIAIHAFSAAVFLQCMHYAIVLGVLPSWERNQNNNFFVRNRPNIVEKTVIFLSTLIFIYFAQSFTDARKLYSIAAAVHAWIEFPILLLAIAIPAEENNKLISN